MTEVIALDFIKVGSVDDSHELRNKWNLELRLPL